MDNIFKIRGFTVMAAAANILIALTKIIAVNMCSVSHEYYGYYYSANAWHSCQAEPMLGEVFWVLETISLFATGVSFMIDITKAKHSLDNVREINITKTLFVISVITITYLIDTVANIHVYTQISGPNKMAFDNMWWAMPVSVALLIWTTWMIVTRREMKYYLKRKY